MVSANEYRDVVKTVTKYVEALRVGSVDMLADTFQKDAVTYGIVNGELVGGSNLAASFIEMNGKSPEIDSHIDVIDITSNTAVVRIVTENDAIGADCNAYLTLVKPDKGWTVVAMVFHEFLKDSN
jgi:hypothetical protein